MEAKLEHYNNGEYLFHGSPDLVDFLEIHQPRILNKQTGKLENHGEPAVAATPYLPVAIFRALYNRKNGGGDNYKTSFSREGSEHFVFQATPETYERVNNSQTKGYVYVLRKNDFIQFSGMEWRSEKSVKPIAIIEVRVSDMPQPIELIES